MPSAEINLTPKYQMGTNLTGLLMGQIRVDTSALILKHQQPIRVQPYDIDYAGHVSNLVYLRWLEDLRIAWLEQFIPLKELFAQGIGSIVSSTHIAYRRPIKPFEEVVAKMGILDHSRVRFTLGAVLEVAGEKAMEAMQTGAFVDLVRGRPVPIPDKLITLSEVLHR
jgi:acyl-CoA thioester hydrolase